MNPESGLIDLAPVLAMLGSFGGTNGTISLVRVLFLDQLLSSLSSTQRDYVLRIVNYLLNFALILGASLLMKEPMGGKLLLSVAVTAWGAFGLSHATYHLAVNTKRTAEPLYAEIPANDPASASITPPPEDDDPAAAALAA